MRLRHLYKGTQLGRISSGIQTLKSTPFDAVLNSAPRVSGVRARAAGSDVGKEVALGSFPGPPPAFSIFVPICFHQAILPSKATIASLSCLVFAPLHPICCIQLGQNTIIRTLHQGKSRQCSAEIHRSQSI